jgi:hypothetical protein
MPNPGFCLPPKKERLHQLEGVLEAGLAKFLEVGRALLEIRKHQLYRDTYGSFEHYCQGRWNFSAHHAARILRSIAVAQHLLEGPANPVNGDCPLPGSGVQPTDEQSSHIWGSWRISRSH